MRSMRCLRLTERFSRFETLQRIDDRSGGRSPQKWTSPRDWALPPSGTCRSPGSVDALSLQRTSQHSERLSNLESHEGTSQLRGSSEVARVDTSLLAEAGFLLVARPNARSACRIAWTPPRPS